MGLAFQGQRAVLEVADQHHDRAAIGHPGLLPVFAHGVVAQDAVADESIGLLVEFAQRAALGDGFDACARDGRAVRGVVLEGIPVSDPEVQLVVLGDVGAAGRCRRRHSRCGRRSDGLVEGAQQYRYEKSLEHDRPLLDGRVKACAPDVVPCAATSIDAIAGAITRLAVFGHHHPRNGVGFTG